MGWNKSNWIQTYTGQAFEFSNPVFVIEDIAHALSNICRYTGHVKFFYSVAQHSVYAWMLAKPAYKRSALLHDISEAYLGDVSTPLKKLLNGYRELEDTIMRCAAEKYNFPYPLSDHVKEIDGILLQTERKFLLTDPPIPWDVPYTLLPAKNFVIEQWSNKRAKLEFLAACEFEGIT